MVTRIAGGGGDNKNINDLASGTSAAITSITTTQITFTVTAATVGGVTNSLTWQNVRVRPSAGTPLASGNITTSGTSAITGVTVGSTNLGTLTEVVGAKSQLVITTQPSTSATAGTDFTTKPVIAVRDQFGNTLTSDSSTTITEAVVLSTQTCGGIAGSGTLSSTPSSGAAVTSGVMTYTAMQYSAAESIKICISSSGITSALSDAVTISAAPTPTPTPSGTPTPTPSGTPTPTPTGTPTPTPTLTPTPTPTPSQEPATVESVDVGSRGGNYPAELVFSGEIYPGAKIQINLLSDFYGKILKKEDEYIVGDTGVFTIKTKGNSIGEQVYGLSVKDRNGSPAIAKFYKYDLKFNTIVKQEDIILAPMASVSKKTLAKSESFTVSGYGAPGNTVEVLSGSKVIGTGTVLKDGNYAVKIDGGKLFLGPHKIQVRQVDDVTKKKGDLSEFYNVTVGQFSYTSVDMNKDDKINIADWSIFLYNWSSPKKETKDKDDLNGDGVVDVTDFSVFLTSFQSRL